MEKKNRKKDSSGSVSMTPIPKELFYLEGEGTELWGARFAQLDGKRNNLKKNLFLVTPGVAGLYEMFGEKRERPSEWPFARCAWLKPRRSGTFVLKKLQKPPTNEQRENPTKQHPSKRTCRWAGTNVNLAPGSHIQTYRIPRRLCYGGHWDVSKGIETSKAYSHRLAISSEHS